ncbi:DNA-directed RNA polymerase III subunit RPC5 [Melipona quadrifasciata]|uniref:DNA-directed RNA polymerase III subunit RPC5 n=1 Tax=Melipona quadrifasciata TaxID=166423 RepID=A0A0N0BBW3_9HYME|nr:DNA-directed RNA polymerase III subunit RPC5 [Melipona quadrifasciata]
MSSTSKMENETDPVVKEIPVYLSKTLADKLFVFQYPVRPSGEGYDNATFLKSSIKPENQEVRIEVSIDIHNVNYDKSKGKQIAINADGDANTSQEDNEKAFDSNIMDKVVLQSSRVLPNCSNFGVGIFQDGELHITPLKGIIQLRPGFDYLDKSDKRIRDEAKNMGEDYDEEDEGPKQVNVTFARQKPEYMKKMQEQSFQHHTKKSLEENWIHTNYVPPNAPEAELTRSEMFCSATDQTINTLNISTKQYLDLLVPKIKEESVSDFANSTSSLNYIRSLPLLDQIKTFMKDAKVISFAQLRSILSPDQEVTAILKYLQQVAVLVQGNWVLLSFTEHEFLDRKTISSVIKLPPDEINEIFTNLAIYETKKGWRLVIPSTKEFTERQEIFWEAKRKHFREAMEIHNQIPQRLRRKSNRESVGSENEERNVGRGRKVLRDSSMSDNDSVMEPVKHKKTIRSRKISETT